MKPIIDNGRLAIEYQHCYDGELRTLTFVFADFEDAIRFQDELMEVICEIKKTLCIGCSEPNPDPSHMLCPTCREKVKKE